MMRIANGIRRRCWLMLVSLIGLFVSVSIASSHPVPAARATLDLQADNRCEIYIKCDASALVMQSTPGHLGKAAEELQALSKEELQVRIDDAQQAIEYYLELKFDDVRQKALVVHLPPLEVIRSSTAHGGEDAWPEILVRGTWPADAITCEVTFPAALGRVHFRVARLGTTFLRRDLAAGKPSGLIKLTDRATTREIKREDWAGWIMVALLLAYLVRLYLGRPKYPSQPYSRSTSTGQ
jgi:hypothetical protein